VLLARLFSWQSCLAGGGGFFSGSGARGFGSSSRLCRLFCRPFCGGFVLRCSATGGLPFLPHGPWRSPWPRPDARPVLDVPRLYSLVDVLGLRFCLGRVYFDLSGRAACPLPRKNEISLSLSAPVRSIRRTELAKRAMACICFSVEGTAPERSWLDGALEVAPNRLLLCDLDRGTG